MANPDADKILRVAEIDYIGFSFWGDDLPAGVTILSGAVSVLPIVGLTLGSAVANITADMDGVYAWVTAGTAGQYDVTFTTIFSDNKKLIRVYRVQVI
jgi:hypothetical protein